jgi:uncharacterized iron-regulated membrane protein
MARFLTRQRLFALHGWLGLNFGILLLVVCFSGSIAALTHEIEWLTEPALRILPKGPIRWQRSYDNLRKAYRDHRISGIARSEATVLRSSAWEAYVTSPDGHWGQVRLNPFTGEIVRPSTSLYLTDFIRQLHYNFFSQPGFYLVCLIALPLLFSVFSGILFYKRFWRNLFTLQLRKGAHAFWSSAHRLLGVWSLVFSLIIGITGVWYLVEDIWIPANTAYPPPPEVPPENLARHGPTPRLFPLDRYVDIAQKVVPELQPSGIALPHGPGGTIAVHGQADHWLVRDRANAVFLDPFDGTVIEVRRADHGGLLNRWIDTADPLHFGYFGGIVTKVLWFILGLCIPLSILSGAYLSFRRAGRFDGKSHVQPNGERGLLSNLHRFPIRTWMTLLILGAIIWSCLEGYFDRRAGPVPTVALGEALIGPWKVMISREKTVYPGATTDYYVRFDAGENRVANFKRATVSMVDSRLSGELSGQTHSMRAQVPTPSPLHGNAKIVLRVEDWTGQQYQASVTDFVGQSPRSYLKPGEARAPDSTGESEARFSGASLVVIWGFILLTVAVVIPWLVIDRRN